MMNNIILSFSIFCIAFLYKGSSLSKENPELYQEIDWKEDIEHIEKTILQYHPDPFTKISKDEFSDSLEQLKKQAGQTSINEMMVSIARVVASIGDSHTAIHIPQTSLYPFSFSWFDDGIYLTACGKTNKELLGTRLKGMADKDLQSILTELSGIIPHENEAQLISKIPSLLVQGNILNGFGITDGSGICEYVFVDSDGIEITTSVDLIYKSGIREFAKNMVWLRPDKRPFTKTRRSENYWYKYIEEYDVIYLQFNKCENIADMEFIDFAMDIVKELITRDPQKLIIDLRNNSGGNSSVFQPLIDQLRILPYFRDKGKLYVIVGRDTFSSAILNAVELRKHTNAIFVGEATGGKPNHFGEVKKVSLPGSGLQLSYSTKYFQVMETNPDSFYPDIEVTYNFKNYIEGKDPAIEYILNSN